MDVPIGYRVATTRDAPPLDGDVNHRVWQAANRLDIACFHPRSSGHRPQTRAWLLYDQDCLYLQFAVKDRYVRSVTTELNGAVCKDSCVEFFVQPRPNRGYFNFEINCGGCLHLSYVEDPTRDEDEGGLGKFTLVPPEELAMVDIHHSLPSVVDPEIKDEQGWCIQLAIPLELMARYCGSLKLHNGDVWRANLYKCGDCTSHPHWASWAPIGEECNFHQPWFFRPILFD